MSPTEVVVEGGSKSPSPPSDGRAPSAILRDIRTPTSSVFVGRAEELGRLTRLLGGVEQGRRSIAIVGGDAGVGKTRLLTEVAARAGRDGMRVLSGGCMETGDVGLPYVPFLDAFRDLGSRPEEADVTAALSTAVPSLARILPAVRDRPPPVGPSGDRFEQVELFGAVLSLLLRLSELAPIVLVIEDIHWADRSTRDLLAFLSRTLRGGRVGIICSYRTDELHRRHPLRPLLAELIRVPDVERIELRPFDREELTQHLEALVGERVEAAAVDRILARSEGNAFLAEELVAAGAARGDVALPEALADVLRGRIEALPEIAVEVLKVASVAGGRVSHELLEAVAGLGETDLETGLREAIAAQVLVTDTESDTYRFRHTLLQEAVYGDLLPGERGRLHRRYTELLSDSGSAAELAYHALAGHDLPLALRSLIRAAADASSVTAPAEAHRHLAQAIDLWEQVPSPEEVAGIDRPGLLLRAATAASNAGEFRRAVQFAREAVAQISAGKDPARAALAHERLGEHLYQSGVLDEGALAIFRRAVDLVPSHPPSAVRARVTAGLARALLGAVRYEEARRWCDEALAVAREARAVEEETHALITLGVLEVRHDNAAAARTVLRDARERAAGTGAHSLELRALYSLGALELDIGDLEAASRALEEAGALAERTGLAWSQYGSNTARLRLFTYYASGRWDDGAALAVALEGRMPGAGVSAGALFIEVGRGLPEVDERLRRLEPLWAEDSWVAYLAGGCAIDHALWRGDLDQARARVARSLELLETTDEDWELSVIWPAALGLSAEAETAHRARLSGNGAAYEEARDRGAHLLERTREAERRARSVGRQVGPEALAWRARAEADWARLEGRTEPSLWDRSVDAFSYGYVYEEARSRWRLAEALLAVGRREEAAGHARGAHQVAARLGALPLLGALEALARRGRLEIGAESERPAAAAGLTPRELEVLGLVAAGRSNQQIADALFISRKTASVHVSNILAKMGLHSRVEAAAAAHRLGLDESPGD